MKSGVLFTQRKTQFNSDLCYEHSTPNKKILKKEIKFERSEVLNKPYNLKVNNFSQMMNKDSFKYKNQYASQQMDEFHHSSQDYGAIKNKNCEFMNSIEETRLNFIQSTSSPLTNFIREDHKSNEKNREMKKKVKIEKLVESYKIFQKKLSDCKKQIQFLRQDKVQYEEIVYQLKTQNGKLLNQLQKVNNQLKIMKNNFQFKKQQNKLSSEIMSIQFYQINQNLIQKSQQSINTNELSHCQQTNFNFSDLQLILNDMKRKISHYQKQISHKQTLNNHQFYLLQKLRNQQNQLNNTQASLLEELQFVLTKNKKLKRQNEEIRNQNEERIGQIILLEQIKAKLQKETRQLQQKIRQFQNNKISIYENFHDVTKQTKEPQSVNFMQMVDQDEIFPSSLTQNLNEICQILDRRQKTVHLTITQCICIQILPNIGDWKQYNKKSQVLKQTEITCNEQSLNNQLKQKQIQIQKLQQELNQAHLFQDEMNQYFQHSKSKLSQLAKQLQLLSFQYRSLKNKYQDIKFKQFNRSSSFNELKRDNINSHQILSAASLCLNDKFQL